MLILCEGLIGSYLNNNILSDSLENELRRRLEMLRKSFVSLELLFVVGGEIVIEIHPRQIFFAKLFTMGLRRVILRTPRPIVNNLDLL